MQWYKFITTKIDWLIRNDCKKEESKLLISGFLDGYGIDFMWDGYKVIIDDTFFELTFNSAGICRGYKSGTTQ